MKNIRNNKGFTLIELLAVIVILAIVTVLASTSLIPFMKNASKNSFAIEVNGAIDAASNAVSLLSIGSLEAGTAGDNFKHDGDKYCFSLDYLVDKGLFKLDTKSLKTNGGAYSGIVLVSKSGEAYSYTVSMRNKDFEVASLANTADKTNVVAATTASFKCPATL